MTCLFFGSAAQAQTLLGDTAAQLDTALSEFDEAQQIHQKQRDRANRLFQSAARRMEAIVATGVNNGRLEYNIGNCFLQAGDIGRAILHYRRAQRLIPRDPYLADNLKQARSRRLTSIEPGRGHRLLRGLLFAHYDFSLAQRTQFALGAFISFWLLLVLRNVVRNRAIVLLILLGAVVTASLAVSVACSRWSDRNAPPGVVTQIDVIAYKGPGTGYQRQFEQPLQPGVEFTLKGRRGDWWHVALPDGNSGWIAEDRAALIPQD